MSSHQCVIQHNKHKHETDTKVTNMSHIWALCMFCLSVHVKWFLWSLLPASLLLRVVQVRLRTSVQVAVIQLSSAPVNPAWPHGTMGYVYTLETKVWSITQPHVASDQKKVLFSRVTSGCVYVLVTWVDIMLWWGLSKQEIQEVCVVYTGSQSKNSGKNICLCMMFVNYVPFTVRQMIKQNVLQSVDLWQRHLKRKVKIKWWLRRLK